MIEPMEWASLLAGASLLGLVGSGHCVGMCGGIAGALAMSPGASSEEGGTAARGGTLATTLTHSLGRISAYGLIGLVLGATGQVMGGLMGVGPLLRLLAGLVIVLVGIRLMGFDLGISHLDRLGLMVWRRFMPGLGRVTSKLGSSGRFVRALVLGGLWGFLPCGLVYAAAAAAIGTGTALSGAAFMIAFGIGTLPAMVLAGSSAGGLATLLRRTTTRRWAGAAMVLLGCWSIWVAGMMAMGGGGGGHHGPHEMDEIAPPSGQHASMPTMNGQTTP